MNMERRGRAIDKVYKRRDRIEMPDFQREEVWTDAKKRLLIDSILKGWHLPKFYFRKIDDGTFDCVDGQQRLTAIWEFFDDALVLDEETAKRVGGAKYSTLPDDVSDAFDDFEIDIEEIADATDQELEELFKRLQLGTPLNTAEKINAIQGDLRDFCHEMAAKSFLKEKIGLKNTRYTHFETVAKWAFVEARGIQPQMRYPQLESLLRDNRTFSRASDTARRISGALDFLDAAFQDNCKIIRNRANTLSLCMLAGRVYAQGMTTASDATAFRDFIQTFFAQLAAEVEKGVKAVDRELLRYQHAITSGSTGGDSIGTRIETLTKRLATHHPRFAKLLGAYHAATDEATRNLSEISAASRDAIYAANRKYSAAHGEDLFKMTTESSAALTIIGEPSRDIVQYGRLIDALYCLVYEGSGACKRMPTPPPAFVMNVKILRTMVRHDIDHGDESEIRKKRLRAAEIFEMYSGKKSPEECGPEEFLSTQVRLLQALLECLHSL
ncbi:MAG: hypothetical protein BVN28_13120 [Nitrospira sp. ST-bin4]|nr:MAG: hypothetical protein BVN28_13120 [Nitrospira sp. ST-bin4]